MARTHRRAYRIDLLAVPLRAAFFDLGGTLVTTTARDPWRAPVMARLASAFPGEPWTDEIYDANIRRPPADEPHRQETHRWLAEWLRDRGVHMADEDVERLRVAFAAPLPSEFRQSPGATDALRWCRRHGMRIVIVSNTLSSADDDVRRNCEALGIAADIDYVLSSCSVGWQKPHPAIFRRALELAGASADEAVMVGDDLGADVAGAKALGMRAVWVSEKEPRSMVVRPDAVIKTLVELPQILAGWV